MEITQKGLTPHLFNRIAARYDLVNVVLSLGMDASWRRYLVSLFPNQYNMHVLDVATGTGAQAFANLASKKIATVVGLDPSVEMLRVAQEKARQKSSGEFITFERASAEEMPFLDGTFDLATMSFGIRNVPDVEKVLQEILRVLRPGGNFYILEFSLPKNSFIRFFHRAYLRFIVPFVGGLLTGDSKAYAYLYKSIENFPYGEDFCKQLRKAGFRTAEAYPFSFGIVTVYSAQR